MSNTKKEDIVLPFEKMKTDKTHYTINYNVDDFGVLRVYKGNTILFEAQDFLSTPKSEIEKFIDENLNERGENES